MTTTKRPVTLEEHRTAGNIVTRYVATYVGKDGLRTLMTAAQGRHTHDTPESAQGWINAVTAPSTNHPDTLKSVYGEDPRFEVRPCECWAGHFDPVGVYFNE